MVNVSVNTRGDGDLADPEGQGLRLCGWALRVVISLSVSLGFGMVGPAGTVGVLAQDSHVSPSSFTPARPGYVYAFPRDHGSHDSFQTEWWYFTGHVLDEDGRRFGYELTFFRRGIDHPDVRNNPSAWAIRQVYLAHFALTDETSGRFRMAEKMSRAGIGKAGARPGGLDVWVDRWSVRAMPGHPHRFQLIAEADQFAVQLTVESLKPPVVHGIEGISQKGEHSHYASHYYSLTRLATRGIVRVEGVEFRVEGESWMDHEFGSADLAEGLVGWDWFSLQLANDHEIMAYWLRRSTGEFSSASSGTLVKEDGTSMPLTREDMQVVVEEYWTSPKSGARYPSQWTFGIPSRDISLRLVPRMADQELITTQSTGVTYWEGAVDVTGTWQGDPIEGKGYVELTGYAKPYRPGN